MPTDGATGGTPSELDELLSGATTVLDAVNAGEWPRATVAVDEIVAAWERYTRGPIPALIEPVMSDAVDDLVSSVDARDAAAATRAAMTVAPSGADLQLRYRPVVEVDLIRFDLWLAQLVIDAAAGDEAAVNGDSFTLDYLRDRIQASVAGADATRLHAGLERTPDGGERRRSPRRRRSSEHLAPLRRHTVSPRPHLDERPKVSSLSGTPPVPS